MYTTFWWGNLKERAHLDDPGINGRLISRWIFRKLDNDTWTRLIWLWDRWHELVNVVMNLPSRMNWLIREKIFTYFYNKFRSVNRMHYVKFWLLQVCGTLDPCFITTHTIHKEGDLQIYIFVIFPNTRHHEQAHVTSGTLIYTLCPFFGREKNTDGTHLG